MAAGSTSRSFPSTPPGSSSVSSIRPTPPRQRSAFRCASRPIRSGTAICPTCGPGQLYGYRVAWPLRTAKGHRFNRNKCCSTPMPRPSAATCWDDELVRLSRSATKMPICRSTSATAPRSRRWAWWSTRPSPGATIGRRASLAQDADLRDARQGLHQAASRGARAFARHLRRAGVRGGDRPSRRAGRHRGRAVAGAPSRRRSPSCRARV